MTDATLQGLIERWDGLAVVSRHHPATGTWVFVALHDTRLGRAVGGTRIKIYDRPYDGLRDAMRLAAGMTRKWAAIGLDSGGGKAVLCLSRPLTGAERTRLLADYGGLLTALRGAFATGQDLGATPADMLELSRHAPWVHGCDPVSGAADDAGPYTARGVLAGIRAALEQATGDASLRGRTVAVEGVGDVGRPLALRLAECGARLRIADLDTGRCREIAAAVGAEVVCADELRFTECDVYAPCAVGATLDAASIPRLRCRIVAGSANNQLDEPADAQRLHARRVLYAPDYVINAGGALAFGLKGRGEIDEPAIERRIDGLGDLLRELFAEAASHGESPLAAAERRIDAVLEAASPIT